MPYIRPQIHWSQHGFTEGKSTVTQLLDYYDPIYHYPDEGLQFGIIYLDFDKAFDKVKPNLTYFGFHGMLYKRFCDYLYNHMQHVTI